MAEPRILFAAGGTGGHVYPAIAVGDELRRQRSEVQIMQVGTGRPFEVEIAAAAGISYASLPTLPPGVALRSPVRFLRENYRALRGAMRILKEFSPQVVVGCGGYASAPIVWTASRMNIPIVLLEQNVLPGRATRRLSRYASIVCLPCPESGAWIPGDVPRLVTGNPVRYEIAQLAEQGGAGIDRSSMPNGSRSRDSSSSSNARLSGFGQSGASQQLQNLSHPHDFTAHGSRANDRDSEQDAADDSPANDLEVSKEQGDASIAIAPGAGHHPAKVSADDGSNVDGSSVDRTDANDPMRSRVLSAATSPREASPPTLLVLGGSLGSTTINDAVLEIVAKHPESLAGWRIVHQTGERDFDRVQLRGRQLSVVQDGGLGVDVNVYRFLPDMPLQLQSASIVISRAGATTLAELACAGRASIVIPYRGAKDDHQTTNARWLSDRAAALLVPEGEQLAERLFTSLRPLIAEKQVRAQLEQNIRETAVPQAARNVVAALLPFLA